MSTKTLQIIDAFDETHQILRSETYVPHDMADAYRLMSQKLALDFSPTIRLLDVLPVFLHGDRHKAIRRQMAIGIAANKAQQESQAEAFLGQLASIVKPGQAVEWMSAVVHPLWLAMKQSGPDDQLDFLDLMTQAPLLFDKRTRLRDRLAINARIRTFIERDEAHAEARLIALGESVLGMTPFVSSFTLSLHAVLSGHLGEPLSSIIYPSIFPSSGVRTTDRYAQGSEDEASPTIKRCILHSPDRTPAENERLLYGAGEHVCLGRPIANNVWAMMTNALSKLPSIVQSSQLIMKYPLPVSEADYLNIQEPFQRPHSLVVTLV